MLLSKRLAVRLESIQAAFVSLKISVDPLLEQNWETIQQIETPSSQYEIIDELVELVVDKAKRLDYSMAAMLAERLLRWMPAALADAPVKLTTIYTLLAESQLGLGQLENATKSIDWALSKRVTVAALLTKLKLLLSLNASSDSITLLFAKLKHCSDEREAVYQMFRMIAEARR